MNLIVLDAIEFNSTKGILVKIVTCIRFGFFFFLWGGVATKLREWGVTKLFGLFSHLCGLKGFSPNVRYTCFNDNTHQILV